MIFGLGLGFSLGHFSDVYLQIFPKSRLLTQAQIFYPNILPRGQIFHPNIFPRYKYSGKEWAIAGKAEPQMPPR